MGSSNFILTIHSENRPGFVTFDLAGVRSTGKHEVLMASTSTPVGRIAKVLRVTAALDELNIQEVERTEEGGHFFAVGEAEADRFARAFKAEHSPALQQGYEKPKTT